MTSEENLFKKEMFDDARSGMRFDVPISTNFKLFKHFSLSASGNLNTVFTPKIIKYSNFNENNLIPKDTINKFSSFRLPCFEYILEDILFISHQHFSSINPFGAKPFCQYMAVCEVEWLMWV